MENILTFDKGNKIFTTTGIFKSLTSLPRTTAEMIGLKIVEFSVLMSDWKSLSLLWATKLTWVSACGRQMYFFVIQGKCSFPYKVYLSLCHPVAMCHVVCLFACVCVFLFVYLFVSFFFFVFVFCLFFFFHFNSRKTGILGCPTAHWLTFIASRNNASRNEILKCENGIFLFRKRGENI